VLRVLLALLALTLPSAAKKVTLRIPLGPGEPEEIVVASFDDSRVSAADVKRWISLLHENGYYATININAYGKCEANDIPGMEQGIEKTRRMVEELDPNAFPPELSTVVTYLKDQQSFWLWVSEQEVEFLKSGTAPETEFTGVDLARCQVHPERLSKAQACNQVFYTWHNCTNQEVMKQLGSYPREQWKAFLDAYGIQERAGSSIDD
jgi:hypothetical protein